MVYSMYFLGGNFVSGQKT